MKTKSIRLSGQSGFSLVELLVVIAVIAIIAAIAIPNISNITNSASVAKNQRNAQNIASVAAAAKAAGVQDDLSGTGAVAALQTGVSGTLNGQVLSFSISELSPDEAAGVMEFLTPAASDTDAIQYNPTGSTAPVGGG